MDEALELEDIDAAYCLLFLREVRDAAFATVDEEGLPAVRVIDVMMVEDGRLYFVAARGKAFCADIMRTRYVAIVGQSQDFRTCRLRGGGGASRRRGRTASPDRPHLRAEPLHARAVPGRFPLRAGTVLPAGCARRVLRSQRQAHRARAVRLGIAARSRRRVRHHGPLPGMRRLRDACPEACIEEGPPYAIVQEHCLRCGLCRETCSFGAIDRRS